MRAGVWAAVWVFVLLVAGMAPAQAQDLGGLARLTGPGALVADGAGVALDLPLSQPVPYRARLWADPPRAVLEFRRLDFAGLGAAATGPVTALRWGEGGGGWTRLVLDLDQPLGLAALSLVTDPATGQARLTARLVPVSADEFARQARVLDPAGQAPPITAPPVPAPDAPFVVVLDPGHGGIDPGASHQALNEAALMLAFAQDLAAALRRAGGFQVVLTREADVFVALETRIQRARAAGAQAFLSLHADSLEDGEASGITIYTLSPDASDAASATLAERHDRADLLGGGADLSGVEDEVAMVLMDVARGETRPRTERLVQALLGAIGGAGLATHPRPWQEAAFSVLKAPDIPSLLIEVGFLSSPTDRARLVDPEWRADLIAAMVAALVHLRDDEAGRALLNRQ